MKSHDHRSIDIVRVIAFAAAMGTVLLAAGCGGPCVENREGAPLTLTSVTNAETGAELDSVMISNVTVDGEPIGHSSGEEDVDSGGDTGTDAGSSNTANNCVLPCAITTFRTGEAEFTVAAEGFESKRVTRISEYQKSRGNGCPVTLSDGRTTTVELQPSSSAM